MAKNPQGVVVIVVEGDSEEALLGRDLKKLISSKRAKFEIYGGDLLFNKELPTNNIKTAVGNFLKAKMMKNRYRKDDILAVVHIIDTDGCLIPKKNIVINEHLDYSTKYADHNIFVRTQGNKEFMENRNLVKAKNLKILNTMDKVLKSIPYQVFYFSSNLEHVVFNDANIIDDKVDRVDSFIDNLDDSIETFLKKYTPIEESSIYRDNYKKSWLFVSDGINSLKRATNVHLTFDFIKRVLEKE